MYYNNIISVFPRFVNPPGGKNLKSRRSLRHSGDCPFHRACGFFQNMLVFL